MVEWENKKIKIHDTCGINLLKKGDIITVKNEGSILTINGKEISPNTGWAFPDIAEKCWEVIEESPLMEVGKWYEFSSLGSSQIGKVESITKLHITCSPWIINKNTFVKSGTFFKGGVFKHPIKELKEEDEAIQKFLPKTSLKDRYVKVIGKWGCDLVRDGDILKVLEDKENSECIQIEKYLGCSRERLKTGELKLMPEGYSPEKKKEAYDAQTEEIKAGDWVVLKDIGSLNTKVFDKPFKVSKIIGRYLYKENVNNNYKEVFRKCTQEEINSVKKEEEWIPQVGEWAKCIGETNKSKLFRMCSGGWTKDRVAQITKIQDHSNAKIIWLEGGCGVWFFPDHIRKALPEEIPKESFSTTVIDHSIIAPEKIDLVKEAIKRYPKGTLFTAVDVDGEARGSQITSDGNFSKWNDNAVAHTSNGLVYANGRWAPIIMDMESFKFNVGDKVSPVSEKGNYYCEPESFHCEIGGKDFRGSSFSKGQKILNRRHVKGVNWYQPFHGGNWCTEDSLELYQEDDCSELCIPVLESSPKSFYTPKELVSTRLLKLVPKNSIDTSVTQIHALELAVKQKSKRILF